VLFAGLRAGEPLDTPSGRIELYSATVASFGYDECPGRPVFRAPGLSPYPVVLICNQPTSRLHSQLDMGGLSQRGKIAQREPLRMHPADAAARGIAGGDVVRVFNELGSLLAGVRLSEACAPGVAQLSTGAWFDPSAPAVATCVHGNPNVLTADVGTSRLAQGCTGQHARVEIARHDGPLPPIRAYDPPLENP
jgi:biotin/methionine sulfoxide reductase